MISKFKTEEIVDIANGLIMDKILYYQPDVKIKVFKPEVKLILIYTYSLINTESFDTQLVGDEIQATANQDMEFLFAFYLAGELQRIYIDIAKGTKIMLPADKVIDRETFKSLIACAIASHLPHKDLTACVLDEFDYLLSDLEA